MSAVNVSIGVGVGVHACVRACLCMRVCVAACRSTHACVYLFPEFCEYKNLSEVVCIPVSFHHRVVHTIVYA